MNDDRSQRLQSFVDWTAAHITGDEKGQAQIYLDRLFQAFARPGLLEVGGTPEFRVRKAKEDGGGVSFADYVWKPIVLIEMKKRGADLARHYQQAFDCWIRLAPGRPKFTVLCPFDEFRGYAVDRRYSSRQISKAASQSAVCSPRENESRTERNHPT